MHTLTTRHTHTLTTLYTHTLTTLTQPMHPQVRLLIEGGAPLGNADDEGLTPLHLAAYSGKLEARFTL